MDEGTRGRLTRRVGEMRPRSDDLDRAGECLIAVDTGCSSGGFLTAVELPSLTVYESR